MRLEQREQATFEARPRRRQVGRDLRGMVRVRVDDRDAAGLATPLEPPAGARELCQDALGVGQDDPRERERGERDGRVPPVVLPGDREWQIHGVELPPPHRLGRIREERLEELLDLPARGELGVVVEIDVRDDRDPRVQRGNRPVGLVALDDEPALPRAGVSSELGHLAADQPGGVQSESREAEGDHRARRRLAVCAGDDDGPAERDELREELGATPSRDEAGECSRDDDLEPPRRARRIGGDRHGNSLQVIEVRRAESSSPSPPAPPPRAC